MGRDRNMNRCVAGSADCASRSSAGGETLLEALRLHYRLRFDPRGLAGEERERLRELARVEADN